MTRITLHDRWINRYGDRVGRNMTWIKIAPTRLAPRRTMVRPSPSARTPTSLIRIKVVRSGNGLLAAYGIRQRRVSDHGASPDTGHAGLRRRGGAQGLSTPEDELFVEQRT